LNRTLAMVEDLMIEIKEEAPETVIELGQLADQLQVAVNSIDKVKASWNAETADTDYENHFRKNVMGQPGA